MNPSLTTTPKISEPKGQLLASIKEVSYALEIPNKPNGTTGYYFYIENDSDGIGPHLTGCRYWNGEVLHVFGNGASSTDMLEAINNVGLEPFDYTAEVATTIDRLRLEAKSRGDVYSPPIIADGTKFEIVIQTHQGTFSFSDWNPGATIDALAPHNAKIAKLKTVLAILEQYYGRIQFGI